MRRHPVLVLPSMLVVLALALGACGAAPTPPAIAVPPTAPTASPAVGSDGAVTVSPALTKAPPTAATTAAAAPTPWAVRAGTIRLATTTSTADTGLLDWLLPKYTAATGVKVDVVAVGTGQAIAIGQRGDADVLLVHARAQEDAFVAAGDARQRFDVMYNDFVIVGPREDPARVASARDAVAAFRAIADTKSTFVSRGDKSGTNTKELAIWSSAKITPTKEMSWYNAIGQGMGDTLVFSNEKGGYTLSDRGTWLATAPRLKNMAIVFGGNSLPDNKDKTLLNPYGVMAVSPDKHPGVQYDLAMPFVKWLTSLETQKLIGSYGVDRYGQPLFYPDSDEYRGSNKG